MASSAEDSRLFRFGVFEIDPRARELRRKGVRVRLQEQPFQVLTLLLRRAGEVVTRDEFRQELWPSSVYVDFDHGLNNAIARLREALGDAASTPHFIETLPRHGYRFIHPLTPAPTETVALPVGPRVPWIWSIAAVFVVLGLIGLTFAPHRPTPTEPSIAVLPFVNMSSDPENEHFADGLSEELINALSGIGGLKVVAQTSSFSFKGKEQSASAIGEALKVNHILEGSVRRSGPRVRISAQLIDTGSGYHRWSQTFDRDFTDILQIQEDIARSVAGALQVNLLGAEDRQLRKRQTQVPEAFRNYLVARAQIAGVFEQRDWGAVKTSFEEAIRLDPEFANAYAGLAQFYFNRALVSLTDVEGGLTLGLNAVERAYALDPDSSEVLAARANFEFARYRFLGELDGYTKAGLDFRRAIELQPSNASALFDYGRTVQWLEPEQAVRLFEQAAQLDPLRHSAVGLRALVLDRQGQHEAARQQVLGLYEHNPRQKNHNAINIAALATYHGRLDEAVVFTREALARGELGQLFQLWGLYMSLGDRDAARETLQSSSVPLVADLSETAELMTDARYDDAFKALDAHRSEFPQSRILDLPTARLALIAGEPDRALTLLKGRLPDLLSGVETVNARNVMPALDLALAYDRTGARAQATEWLDRIARFLDGPDAPHLPMFLYLRARAHAIAGAAEPALRTLDLAYDSGFKTTWAIDLAPQPLLYMDPIDADPAFATLRTDPRYQHWLGRIALDNERQRTDLRTRDAANPAQP